MNNVLDAEENLDFNHPAAKIAEENERYHKESGEKDRNAKQNGIS